MKILLTGSTGFIGGHIRSGLKEDNYLVLPFKGDITEVKDWRTNLEFGAETIICTAGIRTEGPADFKVNKGGVKSLLTALAKTSEKPKTIIYISTQAVYSGLTPPLKENMPVKPATPYAKSKKEAEDIICQIGQKNNIRTVIFRLSVVLGSGVREGNHMSGPLAIWTKNALSGKALEVNQDGQQTRDYIHVADVVSAILLAVRNDKVAGIFNVGGGRRVRLAEFAEWVKEAAKSNSQIVIKGGGESVNDPGDLFSDTSKIRKFGWKPQKTAQNAVSEFVSAF